MNCHDSVHSLAQVQFKQFREHFLLCITFFSHPFVSESKQRNSCKTGMYYKLHLNRMHLFIINTVVICRKTM